MSSIRLPVIDCGMTAVLLQSTPPELALLESFAALFQGISCVMHLAHRCTRNQKSKTANVAVVHGGNYYYYCYYYYYYYYCYHYHYYYYCYYYYHYC